MASHPVAVEVDPLLGLAACDMAEVSGIELGSAPRRLPNFHTMETRVTFVPYGPTVHPVSPALALRLVVAYLCSPLECLTGIAGASRADLNSHLHTAPFLYGFCRSMMINVDCSITGIWRLTWSPASGPTSLTCRKVWSICLCIWRRCALTICFFNSLAS